MSNTFNPLIPSKFPPEYKEKILESLIFMKEKVRNYQGKSLCQPKEETYVCRKR